jgi:hypothetical protein
MHAQVIEHRPNTAPVAPVSGTAKLQSYYLTRAGVAALWVAAAFTIGARPFVGAALLVAYPAWDAAANLIDLARNGGAMRNQSQALNVAVIGAWAILAGLLQLATGVRRWRSVGAQWAMVLSGAQSALAGGFFISKALGSALPGIADIAPYAGFGAFYFAVSGLWLMVRRGK